MPADDNMDDQPTVRHMSWEYFKDLYERERELREAEVDALKAEIRHERELREQRMNMNAAELSLQAKEYERRLDDLNHAHNQAREVLGTYMPRETFEGFRKEMYTWKEVVQNTLAEERGSRQRSTQLIQWALAIVAILSIALKFIGR